jgi:hypothetical protein
MTAETRASDLRPLPRLLYIAVALVVMALAAGGVWAAWRILDHKRVAGAVPVIRADERPVKVPPANPGGLKVPDENIYVLNGGRPADSKIEQLLPEPEAPLPRPAPPPDAAPAPADTEPLAATPAPMPATPTPAPAAATAPPAAAAPLTAAPPAAPPAVAAAAPAPSEAHAGAPAPPRSPRAAAGGYRLHVGSLPTEAAAKTEWERLRRADADILGRLEARIVRTDLGARGVFYRIEAGPIADAAAAERACNTLKERKVGCILVRP